MSGLHLAVCFDGSQESVNALEFATATGHRQMTVLSVAKASKDAAKEGSRAKELEAQASSAVAASVEKLSPSNGEPAVLVLKANDVRSQLVEHIEGADYDLCVVGNRGLGAVKRAFMGSTSQSLLNGLHKTPVCVVRRGDEIFKGPRRYLLAVDGSEPSTRAAELLGRMLLPEDTVHILSLYETVTVGGSGAYARLDASTALMVVQEIMRTKKELAQTAVKEASTAFPGAGERITASVLECSHGFGQELVDYAGRKEVSAVVMGCRGRGAVSRAFLGSVANYVLHESQLPLIVSH